MTETRPTDTDHGPVLNVTEARQGRRGKHVLWILIVSLILVVAALFGSWAARAPQLADSNANNGRASSGGEPFNAPEPAAKQTDVMQAPGVPGETPASSRNTTN